MADEYVEVARFSAPSFQLHVVIRERAAIKGRGYAPRFSWTQVHLHKALEFLCGPLRFRVRVAHVNLRHVRAFALSSVRYVERDQTAPSRGRVPLCHSLSDLQV